MLKWVVSVTSILIFTMSIPAIAQQEQPKLTPEEVQAARANEKRILDTIAESKAHPSPTYTPQQCRADAQRWTSDGTDRRFLMSGGTGIMVNGQMRVMVTDLTPHLPMPALMERIHEMTACQISDKDFQRQYNTYALLQKLLEDEEHTRYSLFLLRHNLLEQFFKEDAEQNR